jgi:transposase
MQNTDTNLRKKIKSLLPHLNERQKRIYLSSEANSIGYGGVTLISALSGVSRPTIIQGKKDIKSLPLELPRSRKKGGGRKSIEKKHPEILIDIEKLIEPSTSGDPMSPLRWTCKSTRNIAEELRLKKYKISYVVVSNLLKKLGYSLQANIKTKEGGKHPDRNKQFEYINEKSKSFMSSGNPVISIDAKKKEIVGNYKNTGKSLHKKQTPTNVKVYDFEMSKATPYGIYDINKNEAFVNVGKSYDTSLFAVESIRRWWQSMGKEKYPESKKILITADSGGSNGIRRRLWKTELQKLSNETGLEITLCHFPPGTSNRNKIEHRLFSFITMNWRGKPLETYQVIVNLIGAVKTRKGLKVRAVLDENIYEKGIKVTDKELEEVNLTRHEFHGEWNYTICQNKQ